MSNFVVVGCLQVLPLLYWIAFNSVVAYLLMTWLSFPDTTGANLFLFAGQLNMRLLLLFLATQPCSH
jgi:hypothetical protein